MGYLRLLLALVVVASHLGPDWFLALEAGKLAVFAFYAISSFFATQAIAQRYHQQPVEFMRRRLKRIFPLYWAALGLTVALLMLADVTPFHELMALPGLIDLTRNATLLIDYSNMPSPVVQAWMLQVMVFWWAMAALGLFENRDRTLLSLGFAFAANQYFDFRYVSLLSGWLPFSVGAAAYWLGLRLPRTSGLNRFCEQSSYPVFLFHYLAGASLWVWWGIERGWLMVGVSSIAVIMGVVALKGFKNAYRRLDIRPIRYARASRSAQ